MMMSRRNFKEELMAGGNITVWINSPGGDRGGRQIYNMLMDYKGDVTVKIDGIAASAASVIAMAGTKVLISPVGMMIHNPATIAWGDTAEMQKANKMLVMIPSSTPQRSRLACLSAKLSPSCG